ncbi:MAG TPA: hypothetical protein DGP39_08685 [Verrucomicrobiales bacterium]|nr:hypothetical protein [Verrucomicrobiales bacterium]
MLIILGYRTAAAWSFIQNMQASLSGLAGGAAGEHNQAWKLPVEKLSPPVPWAVPLPFLPKCRGGS